MLGWLAAHADPLFAVGSAFFGLLMVPTVLAQLRARASTIPLAASVPTFLFLGMFSVLYASLGLWVTAMIELVQTGMWVVVAIQRLAYGGPRIVEKEDNHGHQ